MSGLWAAFVLLKEWFDILESALTYFPSVTWEDWYHSCSVSVKVVSSGEMEQSTFTYV